jgi:DNA/RNA endonuclease G (NUC1)
MILFRNISFTTSSVAALLALSLLVFSCKEPEKVEPLVPPTIAIKTQSVDGEAGSQFITIYAMGDWTVSSSATWLTVSPASGTGGNNMVVISYGENTDAVRTATVTVTSSGGSASANLTQNKLIVPTPEDERGYGAKTAPFKWLEIPETRENDDQEFFTHYMTIGSTETRNYSYYWDYDDLVSSWVAYPLCAWNIGSGSRSDEWGLDPLLPESKQPVLYNAYSGFGSRGHQIPSADRLTTRAANVQTFYFTNMTPQDYDFNGGTWANLENKVRAWARKTGATAGTDTLYVVTGCYVGSSTRKAKDNKGKSVTVPEAYFKALLRYRNNDAVGHKGFMGCAFWFENANKYGSKISKDMSMSLSKLEEKLGYKLFVNLEAMVGTETYKQIKDEDPSTVSWWWN